MKTTRSCDPGDSGPKGELFKELSGVGEALESLIRLSGPISREETICLEDSDGRVLARDVLSTRNLPGFDRAAMDGYAVRASKTSGAGPLTPVYLRLNIDCTPVRTGSLVPEGYDSVVMVEDAVLRKDVVEITAEVHPHRNVSREGEDVSRGDRVLARGHRLRPPDIALLGALGMTGVEVYRRPRVAIIPTGGELVPLGGADLRPGEAYEINGLMCELYVIKWGGQPKRWEIIPDDPELIKRAMIEAEDADLILLSGGTSVGEKDYATRAVGEIGEILFHGLRVTPGKPTALGVVKGKPVVCLPGYPVAALSALYLLVRPALKRMARIDDEPARVSARLEKKIWSRPGYITVARVTLEEGRALPIMTSGAGILSSVTRAEGYVLVSEDMEGLEVGETVEVTLIE